MRFILDDPEDIIQKHLMAGQFYEKDELEVMRQFCPPQAVILDIGANVGNHAVYFSKNFNAKTIYVFEPIARSYRLLLANLCLNYCHNVNVDHVGIALGHVERTGFPYMKYLNNLGSVSISPLPVESDFDPVQVMPGDNLLNQEYVDFIKLDVEGMEIVVLEGLRKTIAKSRPNIFVEVDADNSEEFAKWTEENNYVSLWNNSYLDVNFNYMLVAKERLTT